MKSKPDADEENAAQNEIRIEKTRPPEQGKGDGGGGQEKVGEADKRSTIDPVRERTGGQRKQKK
jgi:hypothetical protein